MIIYLQFGFSQFISFREEDLWNFSQSEHIIGPGSHVEYPTGTKNRYFAEGHPRNIPAKFGSNWPSGFGEEAWNVKSSQTTDAKVMAIVPMDFWCRWTKKTRCVGTTRMSPLWILWTIVNVSPCFNSLSNRPIITNYCLRSVSSSLLKFTRCIQGNNKVVITKYLAKAKSSRCVN